ncbi:hypothetical protein [Caulobacter sp. NIBR1757]|uniref:hypothetical protein n=1 Tax=Caulobacter sp. NIBR1757 TaxID=3016000 RepID=UPI0022F12408|nr:hypothetical protein [Caulobacter sp. NIBR1757]WGM40237.1 hypothetical protein AMEJIAPC_03178 [Caulobacter sp. NIBR1757]
MSGELGKETAGEMTALVFAVLDQQRLDAMIAEPRFGEVSLALLDNWGPHAEDDASMTRTLRDVGHYMAGIWAVGLHGSPEGFNHASLSRLVEPLGLGSRSRVHAMLVYLQVIGLIRPTAATGDGRIKRYAPTPALEALFRARWRRELALCLPLLEDARAALDRWDEPGVFEAFMAATGRFMAGSFLAYDRKAPNLDGISERNAGLTVMGQLVTMAGGDFPPTGPAVINLSELAKRSGVSRQHARNILKVGEKAQFWRTAADGRLSFTQAFDEQIRVLMASYILHLGWCVEQALQAVDAP